MNYQKLSRIKDIAVECIVWVCVFGLAFLLMALTSGCKHATQQKTLASIQLTADAAMKQWGKYVAKEQRRADALPDGERETAHVALLVKRLKVDDAAASSPAHGPPRGNRPATRQPPRLRRTSSPH